MATNLAALIAQHKNLSEAAQKNAGKALGGSMGDAHNAFVAELAKLVQDGKIDYHNPETFINKEVYDRLSPEVKAKVDIASLNIADQLRHVTEFFVSRETPNESPQLQTMIEYLWMMKDRVEQQYGDVYIF